jgi:hypothetical protein
MKTLPDDDPAVSKDVAIYALNEFLSNGIYLFITKLLC